MVFSHLNFKLIKLENKRIIKKTIIFFIKSIIVELVRSFIGNCEQMLPVTWYNRVIEKYDNNSHSNILLNVELNIANNVKNTHKNDNGKRIGEEWVIIISTKEHSNTPKIKDIKATLWFLSCIWKNVIPIGRNDATKNIFIKNVIISNPCVVIIIHKLYMNYYNTARI